MSLKPPGLQSVFSSLCKTPDRRALKRNGLLQLEVSEGNRFMVEKSAHLHPQQQECEAMTIHIAWARNQRKKG